MKWINNLLQWSSLKAIIASSKGLVHYSRDSIFWWCIFILGGWLIAFHKYSVAFHYFTDRIRFLHQTFDWIGELSIVDQSLSIYGKPLSVAARNFCLSPSHQTFSKKTTYVFKMPNLYVESHQAVFRRTFRYMGGCVWKCRGTFHGSLKPADPLL